MKLRTANTRHRRKQLRPYWPWHKDYFQVLDMESISGWPLPSLSRQWLTCGGVDDLQIPIYPYQRAALDALLDERVTGVKFIWPNRLYSLPQPDPNEPSTYAELGRAAHARFEEYVLRETERVIRGDAYGTPDVYVEAAKRMTISGFIDKMTAREAGCPPELAAPYSADKYQK